MSTTKAQIKPTTDIIRGYREKDYTWKKMLGEFIDNAIDAGADNIVLEIERPSRGAKDYVDKITVTDNGSGCEDLQNLFQLGRHNPDENTQIGEFGVGAKEMQMALANQVQVTSRTNGTVRMCDVDFREISSERAWEIEIEEVNHAEGANFRTDFAGGHTGTVIQLNVDREKRLNAGVLERVIQDLQHQYRPALAEGREIKIVDGESTHYLQHWRFPDLEVREDFTVEIGNREAKVRAGQLLSREEDCSGVHFVYGPRIIETRDKSLETGGEPRTLPPTFFAYVELGSGFQLSTNKGAVKSRARLEWAISKKADDLISECREKSEIMKLNRLEAGLEETLQEIMVKERRNSNPDDPDSGTQEPTGDGPSRDDVDNTDDDEEGEVPETENSQTSTGLQIEIGPRSSEEFIESEIVGGGNQLRIYVNSEHDAFVERGIDKIQDMCASIVAARIASDDLSTKLRQVFSGVGIIPGSPLGEVTSEVFRRIDDL